LGGVDGHDTTHHNYLKIDFYRSKGGLTGRLASTADSAGLSILQQSTTQLKNKSSLLADHAESQAAPVVHCTSPPPDGDTRLQGELVQEGKGGDGHGDHDLEGVGACA